MNREEKIKKLFVKFSGLKLVAMTSQINFFESIGKYYDKHGDLSDKQIKVAEEIIEQCKDFSKSWRISFSSEQWT